MNSEWEQHIADVWTAFQNDLPEDEFQSRMDKLLAELPADHPVAIFERACMQDSTGHSDLAVPLYREALELGVTGIRRRRATIQMASSLRNLGRSAESVELLSAERESGSDELDDAVVAFLALALADVGREREGLSMVIESLAPHLPRYQRSSAMYARLLINPDSD